MRTLVGILSVLIPVGLITVVIVEPIVWPRGREVFDILRLVLGVAGILMVIGFIRYTYRSDAVPRDKRGLWTAVLLLGNVFALPFYWLWYIRQPQAPSRGHHDLAV